MRPLAIGIAYILLLVMALHSNGQAAYDAFSAESGERPCFTSRRLHDFARQLRIEINLIRSQPLLYAKYLQQPEVKNSLSRSVDYEDALDDLYNRREEPERNEMRPNSVLSQAACDHAVDMYKDNRFSHSGSDGSDPSERVHRIIPNGDLRPMMIGENLVAGHRLSPRDMALLLLTSRGHRRSIYADGWVHVGTACYDHRRYGIACAQVYSGDFVDRRKPGKRRRFLGIF